MLFGSGGGVLPNDSVTRCGVERSAPTLLVKTAGEGCRSGLQPRAIDQRHAIADARRSAGTAMVSNLARLAGHPRNIRQRARGTSASHADWNRYHLRIP